MSAAVESVSAKDESKEPPANTIANPLTYAIPAPAQHEHGDADISDIESDLEPDQLVPTYLKIKSKLFEIDPHIVDLKPRRQPKAAKARSLKKPQDTAQSPSVRKLLSQLQQLESDALFDQDEAETKWPVIRNQIAQAKALQRRDHVPTSTLGGQSTPTILVATSPQDSDVDAPLKSSDGQSDGDDSSLLGDMFSALPENDASVGTINQNASSENILLRDFGKTTGLAPRKLLEEAVHARYVTPYRFPLGLQLTRC